MNRVARHLKKRYRAKKVESYAVLAGRAAGFGDFSVCVSDGGAGRAWRLALILRARGDVDRRFADVDRNDSGHPAAAGGGGGFLLSKARYGCRLHRFFSR